VDVTGGGAGPGVADRLRELGHNVVDFHSSAPPPPEDADRPSVLKGANARAAGYLRLRDLINGNALTLPPDPLLVEELGALTVETDKRDRALLLGKPALRAALGRSPDRADALMLAVAGAGGATIGGTIGVGF